MSSWVYTITAEVVVDESTFTGMLDCMFCITNRIEISSIQDHLATFSCPAVDSLFAIACEIAPASLQDIALSNQARRSPYRPPARAASDPDLPRRATRR